MNTHSFSYKERLLTVDNITLKYGKKTIFRDVNLHIDNVTRPGISQGQVVSLLGPSGIGKTQLFRFSLMM
jgi:NitT/TauT family transport system ATP-binding protein